MPAILSFQKRNRIARLASQPCDPLVVGRLKVTWTSAFDRWCFLVVASDPAGRRRAAYSNLLPDLVNKTGCTRQEIIDHGRRVQALLFFAQEQLTRSGVLTTLGPKDTHPFTLPAVRAAF